MTSIPDVVVSYQGAFGPPTLGHYEAMKFAAQKALEEYPGKSIHMLFMPTAKGSAKPHLELTKDERIQALTEFCSKLKGEMSEAPISFEPSTIEYAITEEKKSTATIHTLRALKSKYPISEIVLAMGLDNLFDLPFWEESQNYPAFTKKVYVLSRTVTSEDQTKTLQINLNGTPLTFNKYASWNSLYKQPTIGDISYDVSDLKNKLEKLWAKPPTDPTKMSEVKSLKQLFEEIKFVMLKQPSPTSSSLLRVALKKYYSDDQHAGDYLQPLKQLIGRDPVLHSATEEEKVKDPWYVMFKKTHQLEKAEKLASFDADFTAAFPDLKIHSQGGGKRSKNRRRTFKKSIRAGKVV
jgi:nicotinic acid mononucleotide adenylyltransferase